MRPKLVCVICVGTLVAAATTAGIYAAASGSASSMAASFDSSEMRAHTRRLEFSAEATRAAVEHNSDRIVCRRLAVNEVNACNAAAKLRNARGL